MKKKILSVVAAAALVASLTVPAWAAVGSPYGGAEAEGGDVTYTTQAQTGEDSQATQVYETIQGTQMICPGWFRLAWTRAPRLPKTRCSACSRMAQVLRMMTSAACSSAVKP